MDEQEKIDEIILTIDRLVNDAKSNKEILGGLLWIRDTADMYAKALNMEIDLYE